LKKRIKVKLNFPDVRINSKKIYVAQMCTR